MWKKSNNSGRAASTVGHSSKKYYNQRLGAFGEEQAARYLKKKGYRIAARNVRTKAGEIDIIAWDGEELVFAEVKARTNTADFLPCEAVNAPKQRHIKNAALLYIQGQGIEANCRFDVVEVYVRVDGDKLVAEHINHLEDAFY